VADGVDSDDPEDQADEPDLDHRHLRSALEFALAVVEQGQKLRPPLAYPSSLRPFLRQPRLPTTALGKVRRAIDADPGFRRRLSAGAIPELVDPIGIEWLRRDDGWRARIAELVAAANDAEIAVSADQALRRSERRRQAAEDASARSRAEVVALRQRVTELERLLEDGRSASGDAAAQRLAAEAELSAARLGARHANDRADAARVRADAMAAELDTTRRRATDAEAQRDALLAARAERAGSAVSSTDIVELRDVARHVRQLADRLGELVDARPARRMPVGLPGRVAGDARKAAEFLLATPGALVLVDGYNVGLRAWPEVDLDVLRERLLDAVDDHVRRTGVEVVVVFDGADVVGAHSPRRRLARVTFSPAGVTADDVIRAEVDAASFERPVVVVTDDGAIRRDVTAAGANTVSSQPFLDAIRR